MSPKAELLAHFDEAWDHEWESVQSALKDLTEEESHYQHPIYAREEVEDGMPPPGSVMWHLLHLAVCVRHYADAIRSRPDAPPEALAPPASTVEEAIKLYEQARLYLRETVAALSEAQLDESLRSGVGVLELIRASIRHDVWHAAQIKVARRLYRMRDAG